MALTESTKSDERTIGLLPKKKKKKPFLAFRKQPNLSLPSTVRKPLDGSADRQPGRPGRKKPEEDGKPERHESDKPRQGSPLARQPKQRNPACNREEREAPSLTFPSSASPANLSINLFSSPF